MSQHSPPRRVNTQALDDVCRGSLMKFNTSLCALSTDIMFPAWCPTRATQVVHGIGVLQHRLWNDVGMHSNKCGLRRMRKGDDCMGAQPLSHSSSLTKHAVALWPARRTLAPCLGHARRYIRVGGSRLTTQHPPFRERPANSFWGVERLVVRHPPPPGYRLGPPGSQGQGGRPSGLPGLQ